MRYAAGHKEGARTRILDAAGRGFRRLGFGGIGVDGLAKEAGVTSGAFYGHFPSKAEARSRLRPSPASCSFEKPSRPCARARATHGSRHSSTFT